MRVVVIGANACGGKVACRLKRLDPNIEVIMIDKEEIFSYSACGIPYYISGDIPYENNLRETSYKVVRDISFFEEAKGIKILNKTEVEEINREKKVVKVKYLNNEKLDEIPYDKLVIATGSLPKIPSIPGVDLDGVYTSINFRTALEIRQKISKGEVENPVIIGAGFTGLELAEALGDLWGLPVKILEYFPQVLPKIIDPCLSRIVEQHLRDKGIELELNARIKEIIGKDGKVIGIRTEKKEYQADLIILATGVKPNSELAKKAGLLVSPITEGIVVNEKMQTSDPDIYAGGDCVEIRHLITGKKVVMPMGSLANRQGRVIANNIIGEPDIFPGTVGAFILKCFELAIGGCGLSLETAKEEGFEALQALNNQTERSHFYPDAKFGFYSLVFDKKTTKVLGFQAVGPFTDGTLARIHAISSILPYKPTIKDLISLELAYAPPFNNPLDPIHDTAHVAEALIKNMITPISLEETLERLRNGDNNAVFVDLRHPREAEPMVKRFSNWINIPFPELRNRLNELPKDKDLILICSTGRRSYEAERILRANGFERCFVPLGGWNFPRRWGEDIE